MFISEQFFIQFRQNKPFILDVKNKQEFEITDSEIIKTLLDISFDKKTNEEKLSELKNASLILNNSQQAYLLNRYKNILVDLFDTGSSNLFNVMYKLNKKDFAQVFLDTKKTLFHRELPELRSVKNYNEQDVIALPKPNLDKLRNISFFDILDNRQTIRQFQPHTTDLQTFADVLFSSLGKFHNGKDKEKQYEPFYRRTSPSGGSLQVIQGYVLVYNVENLENGIYFYDAESHSLCKEKDIIPYEELAKLLGGQFFAEHCDFAIFLTADIERLRWKYNTSRNYKVVNLEAGHFSQTLQLILTAYDLQTWITGAFMDHLIDDLLDLPNKNNTALFFIAVGVGERKPMHDLMIEALKE